MGGNHGRQSWQVKGRTGAIDLGAVAERRGRDLVITGEERKTLRGRCSRCGAVTTTSRIALRAAPFSEHFRNGSLT
jgi:hypothetical protein